MSVSSPSSSSNYFSGKVVKPKTNTGRIVNKRHRVVNNSDTWNKMAPQGGSAHTFLQKAILARSNDGSRIGWSKKLSKSRIEGILAEINRDKPAEAHLSFADAKQLDQTSIEHVSCGSTSSPGRNSTSPTPKKEAFSPTASSSQDSSSWVPKTSPFSFETKPLLPTSSAPVSTAFSSNAFGIPATSVVKAENPVQTSQATALPLHQPIPHKRVVDFRNLDGTRLTFPAGLDGQAIPGQPALHPSQRKVNTHHQYIPGDGASVTPLGWHSAAYIEAKMVDQRNLDGTRWAYPLGVGNKPIVGSNPFHASKRKPNPEFKDLDFDTINNRSATPKGGLSKPYYQTYPLEGYPLPIYN